jgi:PST family polysaccharide transporter
MGITILGIVSSKEQVGVYSAIYKIPSILLLIWIPISQVLYPISSKKMKDNIKNGQQFIKNISKYIGLFLVAISLIICSFSKFIISFIFGNDYVEYSYILILLILWLNIGIWNNFLGIQTLLAGGFDQIYSKCFQISVVITIILNIILIKSFNLLGAAITPLLSESILFILLLSAIKKINSNKIPKGKV